jgi:hypothetical protein
MERSLIVDINNISSALLGTPSAKLIHDYYPFAKEDGGRLAPMADELFDRLAILVAFRRFSDMGAADSRSLRSDNYVRVQHFVRRSTYVPFRRLLGDVRREFMQRLSAALHGTLGSYLRDAFQEGSADAVACLPVPRAWVFFLFFAWWPPMLQISSFCLVASNAFSCNFIIIMVRLGKSRGLLPYPPCVRDSSPCGWYHRY